MTDAMHRGGPDDNGHIVNTEQGYALGHRRLSIIDISPTGHQPMIDVSSSLEIVFNGEIYNYKELKDELISLGHKFVTESDTEVILKGYQEWRVEVLNRLRGMFAFVLIDKKASTLFAARDHAGIKPLYIGKKNNSVYISSEIRGIKAIDNDWEENETWKIWFLTYGFLPEPVTTLKNVSPLASGHYFIKNLVSGKEEVRKYYGYTYKNHCDDLYEKAVEKTKNLLTQSVKRHLVSDVPVGVFLSGGIDSSILTILAQQLSNTQIETLSIYFDDEQFSEKEFQDIIINQTGVKHHSYKVSKQDFIDSWNDIYDSIDQPSIDAINSYFICKYAKQNGLKVVLSGLGADEIFGGYPSIQRSLKFKKYSRLATLLRLIPGFSYPLKKVEFLEKNLSSSEYLLYRGLFTPKDVAKILNISTKQVWNVIKTHKSQEDISNFSPQNRASYLEISTYMQNQLLRDSDTQSMWHSLELRVPFLDVDLINYVNNLHPSIRFKEISQKTKPLLVDAFIDILPKEIWDRTKQGFTFPFGNWFKTMPIFENNSIIPNWIHQAFISNKINFSRLWASFLIGQSTTLQIDKKINVSQFQRKRRKSGNHSIENYFETIRTLQPKDINIEKKVFSYESLGLVNRLLIAFEAYKNRAQINHITGDIHFANFLLPQKNTVLTIHDCGILKRRKGLRQKLLKYFWFTYPAKKSCLITVNSTATKQDLLKYINYPENKIKVINIFIPDVHTYTPKQFNTQKPVILQIGTAPNKNIPKIAESLKDINCKYIILGELDIDASNALNKYKIDFENISTSISNEEVAELYRQCDIVSFASTFEGFGMPIAEANATGRVVVTGNTSSMPEVAANAAILVNPFDAASIREGFLKAINDDNYRNELIENGLQNAKRFNKHTIANEYFNIYRQISINA